MTDSLQLAKTAFLKGFQQGLDWKPATVVVRHALATFRVQCEIQPAGPDRIRLRVGRHTLRVKRRRVTLVPPKIQ